MSDFTYGDEGDIYNDPGAIAGLETSDFNPAAFGSALQQASELGAQRALMMVAQAHDQQAAMDMQVKGHETFLKAEEALRAYDPSWGDEDVRHTAYAALQQNPTFAH